METPHFNKLLTDESSPLGLCAVLDEAHFLISQIAVKDPANVPRGNVPLDEMLFYIHKMKSAIYADGQAGNARQTLAM